MKFKHLLDQYAKGQLSETDSRELENWLDAMEDKDAFDTLPPGELANDKAAMYHRLLQRISDDSSKKVFRLPATLKIAAAVIFLLSAGWLCRENILNLLAPHRITYAAGKTGTIKKQILSDGSIVWLKGASKLSYPAHFDDGNREVTIEGEALFEITKDAQHPFLLHCGSLVTKVLGTSFNIRRSKEETAVYVLTGAVALSGGQILYAHENAIYSEIKATVIKGQTVHTVHEFTKGTEYDMAFNDATMRDVIKRIEQKFEVTIQLKDPAILHNLITADVTDQSLKNTMEMISQALNLNVEIKGKTIILQPK